MKNLTFRDFISLLLLLLGLLVLAASLQSYRSKASTSFYRAIDFQQEKNEKNHRKIIKELKTLLNKPKVTAKNYEVVVEKNLFAANRQAWRSPTAAASAGDKEEKKPEVKKSKAKQDVILYGTMIRGDKKMALLEFKRFRRDRPKRLVSEGETVSSDSSRGRSYTLVSVDKTSVVIKEEQSGESYTIPLFDSVKKRPSRTANRSVNQGAGGSVGRRSKTSTAERLKSRRLTTGRRLPSRRVPAVNNSLKLSPNDRSRSRDLPAAGARKNDVLEQDGNLPEMPPPRSKPSVRIRRYHPVVPEN